MPETSDGKHPLDDCDPNECYQTMMSERTVLITAQRESEDNLIKTIIQLSSTMIALTAGFSAQSNFDISGSSFFAAAIGIIFLVLATFFGLIEHWFASKAYAQQQKLLVDYYQKKISEFEDPKANKCVRWSQRAALISFTIAMIFVAMLAVLQFKESPNVGKISTPSATPSAKS